MTHHRIHLAAGRAERVDRLLADSLAGCSRRRLQAMIAEGLVRIDGRRARKGDVLQGERWIDVELLASGALELPPEAEPAVDVLFEDSACIVLDKPPGRPGHALRSGERGTVANFIAARFPECVTAGETPLEAGLVHRLDTDTSGALLAARSREAWGNLRRQFRSRTVGKTYVAVVRGALRAGGEIVRAIEPDPRSRRKVRVLAANAGSGRARPAITRYRPLSWTAAATLLEVEISTGVMHQIRAHLASIGHPVLGDTRYGGESVEEGRHLLHARRIAFDHPQRGERITVESPLPRDFAGALSRAGLQSRLLLKV